MTGRPLYHPSPKLLEGRVGTLVPLQLPIRSETVRVIASKGFPFKESIPQLVARNRRITLAYEDLSHQLFELFASRQPSVCCANWCTFAAWSSKTIGATIDPDDIPPILRTPSGRAGRLRRRLVGGLQWMTRRSHGSIFRALAAGNRFIFLEVARAVTGFIDALSEGQRRADGTVDWTEVWRDPRWADDTYREQVWATYWGTTEELLVELSNLDPSWLPTDAPDAALLRFGMRLYFEAVFETDENIKSELILAGNIQLGSYEQYRADGYVATSLAIRNHQAFRGLMRWQTGRARRFYNRFAIWVWSRFATRWLMALILPNEIVKVSRRLPAPFEPAGETGWTKRRPNLFDGHVLDIEEPRLQALLSRYDIDDFEDTKRGAKNWISYTERMHFIGNLFRSRHTDEALLTVPVFNAEERARLIAGDGGSPSAPRLVE